MHFRVFYSICGDNPKMYGDKIKGQAPIKLNEWNHKRGNDRNAIPFHNIRFIFLLYSSVLMDNIHNSIVLIKH